MIYELKHSEFKRIEHLLNGDFINLDIKAVVKGFNPGWVFVDSVEDPKTAMVWSKGIKGFFFIGDSNNSSFTNDIASFIDREVTPRAKKLGLDYFEFSGTSLEWEEKLEDIFKDHGLDKSKQFVYLHNLLGQEPIKNVEIDGEYLVKKINKKFLTSDITNLDFAKSIILEWWDCVDDYLNIGVGFCILHNNEITSICVSSFVTENSMESHIVTLENYRKKGLAQKAVSEFLKHCNDNNYEPYWDCMEKNTGSRALAESLGYHKHHEYSLYEFKLR